MLTVGVELEMALSRDLAEAVVCEVLGQPIVRRRRFGGARRATGEEYTDAWTSGGWRVGFDPSLRLDGVPHAEQVEVASGVLQVEQASEVGRVAEALRAAGATLTPRCGLHVHVGGAWTADTVLAACRLSASRWTLPTGKRARYCRPLPAELLALPAGSSMDALQTAFYGGPQRPTSRLGAGPARHRAVNLHSLWYRGTLEFRWFDGSLDADQIAAAVGLALAIARDAGCT